MCLIIFAPKGVSKKSEFLTKAIETAAITNDDGMGFMYKEEGSITFKKGFTSTVDLIQAIDAINPTDDGLLSIHLRIGNKGAKNNKMCHPFTCSKDEEQLLALEGTVDMPVMVHNGTFMGITLENDLSDTAIFARDYMSVPAVADLFYNYTTMFKELFSNKLSVSRVLVFYPGDVKDYQKVGTWYEDQGYFFSNESYKSANIRDVGGVTTKKGGRGRQTTFPYPNKSKSNREQDEYEKYWETRYRDPRPSEDDFAAARATGRKFNSNNTASVSSNTSTSISDKPTLKNYKRKSRTDIMGSTLRSLPDNLAKHTFTDIVGYDYYRYMGILLKKDLHCYVSDIASLEYIPNTYNYDILKLQAKVSPKEHPGIHENAYYKIVRILTKSNGEEEQFVSIERQVKLTGNETVITLPMDKLNDIFSITPVSEELRQRYFDAYHDILTYGNNSNAKQRDYLKSIKGKKDDEIVNIKKLGLYPAKVIKWYVYQSRLNQGKNAKATRLFINELI